MSQKRPVYAIEMPVGLPDKKGVRPVVVLEIKQSRAGADEVASKNPGSAVKKYMMS